MKYNKVPQITLIQEEFQMNTQAQEKIDAELKALEVEHNERIEALDLDDIEKQMLALIAQIGG